MKKITKNLKELQGNMKGRVFSRKCGIGNSTMHNYLNGRKMPEDIIIKICKATNRSADWLLGLSQGKLGNAERRLATIINEMKADVIEKQKLLKELGV